MRSSKCVASMILSNWRFLPLPKARCYTDAAGGGPRITVTKGLELKLSPNVAGKPKVIPGQLTALPGKGEPTGK